MRARLVLLGGQTVALGLMTAFLVVPVSAVFLDEYGADTLPYVYLAVAAAGVVVSWAMSRAERRLSLARLAIVVVGAYLVAVALGWGVLVGADGLWVTFPLLVLFPLSIPIGFVLVGSQAGRLLDVRQMKAHFPRVAAGFSVGFALGGLAAAALVGPVGDPRHLVVLDVLAAGVMLALVAATARRFPGELDTAPRQPEAQSQSRRLRGSWQGLLANRMVALILAYQLLSAAVTQLLDYMVWERAAARYDDPASLAQFQGVFGAVINISSVLFVIGFAGWLLTRFGVGFGLAANPLGVLLLLVATTVTGAAAGTAGLAFLVLVCAQQVTDISLTDGTTRTSINATYQALQPGERVRAQTMVEGAGVPLALGFVGVMLIVFDALALDIRAVVVVTLGLTAVWLATAFLAFREYGVNLRAVLTRRAWDPVALRIDDTASQDAVSSLLRSSDPYDVQVALDALVDAGQDVSSHVLALLGDVDAERRSLGLQVAVTTDRLAQPDVSTRVRQLLDDADETVALSAAAASVRLPAGQRETARAAWVAALSAADDESVIAALRAAATHPHGFFVPYLVGLASSGAPSAEVLDALGAHAHLLATRAIGLLQDSSVPRVTRERIVHFLGRAATPEARDLLVEHLDDGDPFIVEAAATCLVSVGHRETTDALDLDVRVQAAAERAGRCAQVLQLLDGRASFQPLQAALRDELADVARRVQVLLDLVHDPQVVAAAVSGLASHVERERSTALETLEVTVGRSTAQLTRLLTDRGLGDDARLAGLVAPGSGRALTAWLHELVVDEEGYWQAPWLRACALYALPGALSAEDALALARPLVDDPDRDVAETARWVVSPATGT